MFRFLVLSLVLLTLLLALSGAAFGAFGGAPRAAGVDFGLGAGELPRAVVLGTWALEALGLTALFLLIQGRAGSRWLDGLAAAWIAWVFRGPLLVLTVAGATRLPRAPWWSMALRWWIVYTLCGLLLAALARQVGLER